MPFLNSSNRWWSRYNAASCRGTQIEKGGTDD